MDIIAMWTDYLSKIHHEF